MGGTCLLFFIMTENAGDVKIKGFSQGDFAAPAASDFARGGKVTKTPPGTRPMDYGSAPLRLGP